MLASSLQSNLQIVIVQSNQKNKNAQPPLSSRVVCGRINRFIHYVPSPQPHRSLLAYGAFSLMLESVFRCLLYRAQINKNAAPVTSSREWLFDDANKPTKSFLTTSSLSGFPSTIHKPLEYYYYITFTKPQARNKPLTSPLSPSSPQCGVGLSAASSR